MSYKSSTANRQTFRLPFPHQDGAPEWAQKKDIYKVYRPANVLAAACSKFKLLPLTHHHPSALVDSRNFRDLTIGYTGENPFIDYLGDKDEIGIRSNVLLYDDEAQGAYERGEKQLSPGYIATFEWQQGKSPHGESYDIVMKEICDVNHLALLPSGRGGEDAVVLDKEPERQTIFDVVRMTKDEQDANGNEHSPSNGQFVSKGEGGTSKGKNKDGIEENDDSGYPEKNYPEYKGTGQKAVDFLVKNKSGQVKGAFSRQDIGDIDVVWGEVTNKIEHTGYGLSHIIDKHGDSAAKKLGDVVETGDVTMTDKRGRIYIEKDNYRVVIRKSWNGNHKKWIVTGFEKELAGNRTVSRSAGNNVAETSPQPTTDSIAQPEKKIKTIFERVQGTIFDLYAP
ncbi:DUF2213 domain-containing protein [Treponema lecithinolyticum]|uniref:putative barnase/colicin E5 family endoribonuclease n=1 Tax=Treponema lecithinolyticum TaxID=53418 RepID=UPI0028E66126|nr:DUF2213 domain-containing protein [Treponema lecithinolyticum]